MRVSVEFFFRSVELAENMEKVRASSPTKLTPEMTRLLALVIFEGYELFPARHSHDSSL